MRTLTSLFMFTLIGACSVLAAKDNTPGRTPPLLEEYRAESFKPYRTPERPTDGYEMKFPYQFATWKLTRLATRDKDDKRDDICLIGARPTMVIVPGWYLRFHMASQNSKPTESEQLRHDALRTLFKELEEHAKANKKEYDVLVLFSNQNDDDREAILKIYNESKPEYIELAEAAPGLGKNDNNAGNYWNNLIQTPDKEMVTNNATAPKAVASWVWMPKPGTAEAWGVWGFDSEAKRLKKFVKDTEAPKALKISNSDQREIADMLAHWRLGDAEKQIEKLEKKAAKSDARNIELLREFEKQLEEAYREGIAGVHKRAGYLVEYADAMTAFAETYYTKKSTRGGEILDEIKAFKKTDEYEHVEDAKKAFDKLSDSIYSQLNGGLHGDAYAKHHTTIIKKHKSSIEKFNEEFGDTPYAETTKKWADEANDE